MGGKKDKGTKGKSKKTVIDDKQKEQFETMIYNVFQDLIKDVSKVSSESSVKLSNEVGKLSKSNLVKNLSKTDSELYKAFPSDLLVKDVNGRRYLTLLGCVQKNFLELVANNVIDSSAQTVDNLLQNAPSSSSLSQNAATSGQITGENQMFEDKMKELMGGNNDLMKLANSAMKDLNIKDFAEKKDVGMNDLLSIMSDLSTYVQNKAAKGEIDMDNLQGQMQSMCSNLQNSPEFSQVVQLNPNLERMMNVAMTMNANGENNEGGGGIADLLGGGGIADLLGEGGIADLLGSFSK